MAPPGDRRPDRRGLRRLRAGRGALRRATEDAYRAGYLAGIRAVAQMGQLLSGTGAARPPKEPVE